MDDLTKVRHLRAATPGPDPAVVEAARRRLRASMERRPRRLVAPGLAIPAAAALAVLAIVAGLSVLPGRGGRLAAPETGAAAFLETLAGAAAAQPDTGPPGDRIWYHQIVEARLDEESAAAAVGGPQPEVVVTRFAHRTVREEWTTVAGPGYLRQRDRGSPTGLDPSLRRLWDDRRTPEPDVLTPLDGAGHFSVGESTMSWADVERLPSDPDALRDALPASRYRTGGPVEQWQALVSLLQAPLRPGPRAAVLRLLATTPGLHLVGPVDGPEGVRGSAVSIPLEGDVVRIIFDEHTGRLLATETRLTVGDAELGAPAGAVVGYTLVGPAGYVAARGDVPAP